MAGSVKCGGLAWSDSAEGRRPRRRGAERNLVVPGAAQTVAEDEAVETGRLHRCRLHHPRLRRHSAPVRQSEEFLEQPGG
jgi:hypothetical protein